MTGESPAARVASGAYWAMRQSVQELAQAQGAGVREKPVYPGAAGNTRYADPYPDRPGGTR